MYRMDLVRSINLKSFLPLLSFCSLFCHTALAEDEILDQILTPPTCSCETKSNVEKAFQESSTVFVGRVEQIIESPLRPEMYEVKFVLLTNYKGDDTEGRFRVVYTPLTEALCGYAFTPGQEYVVYATGNPAYYKTNSCTRTAILDLTRDDLGKLSDLSKKEKPEA